MYIFAEIFFKVSNYWRRFSRGRSYRLHNRNDWL